MPNKLKKAKVLINNISRVILGKSTLINVNLIATNLCNQHCPMCNTTLMRDQKNVFTLEIFKKYIKKLKSYNLASCTISGGEATLIKDLPEVIEEASKNFPFGVLLITNLYGNTVKVMKSVESALRNNVNLSISFDGFGDVADKLRGSSNVSETVLKHMRMVKEMQVSLNSRSHITLHTVLADDNLPQITKICDLSKQFGWKQTIAPVNVFYYQNNSDFIPSLSLSQKLIDVCEMAMKEEHIDMMDTYIKGIALYANKTAPKLCPYLKSYLKSYKFFLEPSGDVSLCDRTAIGNINENHIDKMLNKEQYQLSCEEFKNCEGCWLGCFVEPELRLNPKLAKEVGVLYEKVKLDVKETKPKEEVIETLAPVQAVNT